MQAHLQSGAERTPAKFYKTKWEWTLQMGLSRNADKQYLSTEYKLVTWEGADLSGVKYTKEKSASNDNNVSRWSLSNEMTKFILSDVVGANVLQADFRAGSEPESVHRENGK